jgi:drug/metabolite transporter (DMT)-like permease
MKTKSLKSDALLLLTAAIWGSAFVAQRVGMEHIGPFTYNGIRFTLGALTLLPLVLKRRRQAAKNTPASGHRLLLGGSLLAGLCLFLGAALQQRGLVYTTAGKAGFITGLYVVLVPLLGLLWRQRPGIGTWYGAFLAVIGLYLLGVTEHFTVAPGDFLVLAGTIFWAFHVLTLGWFSPRTDSIQLAFYQFGVCAILSLLAALMTEPISLEKIGAAAMPIFYGGCLSVGLAYTLQVVAQKDAEPAHAAIILSLETVFAGLAGWLLLGEKLSHRGLLGCALILGGMLLSQVNFRIPSLVRRPRTPVAEPAIGASPRI